MVRTFHHTQGQRSRGGHPTVFLYYILANIVHAHEPVALGPVLNLMYSVKWLQ